MVIFDEEILIFFHFKWDSCMDGIMAATVCPDPL